MSDQVNKEQTKDTKQKKITELTDDQLDEAAGGSLSLGKAVNVIHKTQRSLDGKGYDIIDYHYCPVKSRIESAG